MIRRIEQDKSRFDRIVRGRIKKGLRQYITHGEMIGRQGKEFVSIPLPQIEIPRLRYGDNKSGGVGAGDGELGDVVGQGEGDGTGQAGDAPGRHITEVDVPLSELAAILGEELELPRIEPRGKKNLTSVRDRYVGIRSTGPESLRHFKRSFKEALRRELSTGTYDPQNPCIVLQKPDRRYRSWREVRQPESNAVIVYIMDVSGSMGDEQKEIVRIESFWIDTWLRHQYEGLETRFIIHDAVAREVDRDTFFRTRESGGTMISSAYKLASELIDQHYPISEWNIYLFHFSDGDNWSVDDTLLCVQLLKDKLLPAANVFCYGQVESPYGSGQFIKDIEEHFPEDDRILTSEIRDRDAIVDSIKDFLGKGK
jgi:uncharacterized sporulation protein YeaH/YhbH (DUF444 family)